MILNNHLYILYHTKRKNLITNNIFGEYSEIQDDISCKTEQIVGQDKDYNFNNKIDNLYLKLFPENTYLIKNIIQCLDKDILDFEYLCFNILQIFFNYNELNIKNLHYLFELLIDTLIILEIFIHIHILLLNIHFFNENMFSMFLNLDIDKLDKGNNYLMLIKILINTSNTFQSYHQNSRILQEKNLTDYIEKYKENTSKMMNFNLDNTLKELFESIDTQETHKVINKNIIIKTVSNMYGQFKNNILDFINIFIDILDKDGISIPTNEKENIFILITTVFNYNIVKLNQ
jgi:hypothetical protein